MPSRRINLTFHGIGETERPLDADEERFWLGEDDFESALDSVVGRRNVRITFDDGNASDIEHALPQLRQRGLSATFFVVAGRLGVSGFLDEDDVRSLADAGMGIGCHGMRHRQWRRLDRPALWEEVVEASRILERTVGRPVTEAACPFGSYDRRVLRFLRAHGYRTIFTSDSGTARAGDWVQARNSVRPGNPVGAIERVLVGERSHSGVRRRVELAAKRWR